MARDLRYATATLVTVGPFIDILGLVLEDAIAEGADEKITFICDGVANGAPTVVLDMVATNASTDNDVVDLGTSGCYSLELTAANTTYLGRAMLTMTNAAVHCPVMHEFNILTQVEFDKKYGTGNSVGEAEILTRIPDATAGANGGLTICGSNAAATFANLTVSGTSALGAVTATTIAASGAVTLTGGINAGAISGTLANDLITAASIANAAIDNATFAADVGSTAYATNIIALAADKAVVNAALATAAELAKVPKSDSNVTWNATALASINAEMDTALNTAIPGGPTANSINERIAAIDDLTQAAGAGDLAAILTDTSTTLDTKLNTIDDFLDTEMAATLAAVDTEVADIKAKTDNLPQGIKRNTALAKFEFVMVDATTKAPLAGLTVAGARSIDGGAFAALTNTATITEVANGVYWCDLAAADLNGVMITLRFTSVGADDTLIHVKTDA